MDTEQTLPVPAQEKAGKVTQQVQVRAVDDAMNSDMQTQSAVPGLAPEFAEKPALPGV